MKMGWRGRQEGLGVERRIAMKREGSGEGREFRRQEGKTFTKMQSAIRQRNKEIGASTYQSQKKVNLTKLKGFKDMSELCRKEADNQKKVGA